MHTDPLNARLFGYGVPYRVRFDAGGAVQALPTDAALEAKRLAGELEALTGGEAEPAAEEGDAWAISMPFGRCGVNGLPLEYLMVHHQAEAYLEVLTPAGVEVNNLSPGQIVTLKPGRVARLRARPLPGRQVLVAFQTEDRTPLQGNAAPFCPDHELPDEFADRLRTCHAAFQQTRSQACMQAARYTGVLQDFFGRMAEKIAADPVVHATQAAARSTGTYDVDDQVPLFERQKALLTPEIIQRTGAADPVLFRFPGMFGGIAMLYQLFPAD